MGGIFGVACGAERDAEEAPRDVAFTDGITGSFGACFHTGPRDEFVPTAGAAPAPPWDDAMPPPAVGRPLGDVIGDFTSRADPRCSRGGLRGDMVAGGPRVGDEAAAVTAAAPPPPPPPRAPRAPGEAAYCCASGGTTAVALRCGDASPDDTTDAAWMRDDTRADFTRMSSHAFTTPCTRGHRGHSTGV